MHKKKGESASLSTETSLPSVWAVPEHCSNSFTERFPRRVRTWFLADPLEKTSEGARWNLGLFTAKVETARISNGKDVYKTQAVTFEEYFALTVPSLAANPWLLMGYLLQVGDVQTNIVAPGAVRVHDRKVEYDCVLGWGAINALVCDLYVIPTFTKNPRLLGFLNSALFLRAELM